MLVGDVNSKYTMRRFHCAKILLKKVNTIKVCVYYVNLFRKEKTTLACVVLDFL